MMTKTSIKNILSAFRSAFDITDTTDSFNSLHQFAIKCQNKVTKELYSKMSQSHSVARMSIYFFINEKDCLKDTQQEIGSEQKNIPTKRCFGDAHFYLKCNVMCLIHVCSPLSLC